MSFAVRSAEPPEEGLKHLLASLLESRRVSAVFSLARTEKGKMAYELITDPKGIADGAPLHPMMPVNLGQLLNRFTMMGPSHEPIAVVIRPCELRAFVETVKRRMSHLENLFFISYTCGGVFTLKSSLDTEIDDRTPDYWEKVGANEIHPGLRTTCQSCVEFVPYTSDVTLRIVDGSGLFEAVAETERGEELVKGLGFEEGEGALDRSRLDTLLAKREKRRGEAFASDAARPGLDGLLEQFGRCVGCHACRQACPICYCNLCTFESNIFEKRPEDHRRELTEKGGTRLPPDTIFFHLGRMIHMAISCVACGSCSDVCPVDIPVALNFKRVGESLQRTFNYDPGKSAKEPVPVGTFEKEEFLDIEGAKEQ
jgi:formate dehydrogenase subunit beta